MTFGGELRCRSADPPDGQVLWRGLGSDPGCAGLDGAEAFATFLLVPVQGRHAHVAGLDWWDLAEVRLRLDRLRNGSGQLFSPARHATGRAGTPDPAFLAGQNSGLTHRLVYACCLSTFFAVFPCPGIPSWRWSNVYAPLSSESIGGSE
jgi:hypothetical protein